MYLEKAGFEKKNMYPVELFGWDWLEKYEFGSPIRNHVSFCFFDGKDATFPHNARVTHRREQTRAAACVFACAPPSASCFLLQRRLGSHHSQRLFRGRREPKNATRGTATAGCSYRSLERILCVLGLPLDSRAVCAIVQFEKLRLRPP